MNETIERIKKLLRRSKSANPHEAELAMRRAMELAARHRIDLDRLSLDDQEQTTKHEYTASWARLPLEAKLTAGIVDSFFGVRAIVFRSWRDSIAIVGRPSDVEIGLYVFGFLVAHFRRCWNKRTNRRLRNREAFMEGLYAGLYSKLAAARSAMAGEGSTAIVDRYEDYISRALGPLKDVQVYKGDAQAHAARDAGWREGRKTNIHPAVHRAKEERGILLH